MIPFIHIIVWTFIALKAAIVPLSIGAAPFITRMVENVLLEIPASLVETFSAIGATPPQIIRKVVLPEALLALINATTIILITIMGYSAMVATVGTGDLGQIGI